MRWILPSLGLLLVLTACSADKEFEAKRVSRDDYGHRWPLTVDEAVLACETGGVPTLTTQGRSYRLDGEPAKNASAGFRRIWALDPALGAEASKDLSPLMRDALALCD